MAFIIAVISIVALVLAISHGSEIKKLKQENENCKMAIGEILDVLNDNPELQKQLSQPTQEIIHQQISPVKSSADTNVAKKTNYVQPQIVQQRPVAQQTSTPITPSQQSRTFTPIPNAKQQKQTQHIPTSKVQKAPKENANFENVFGKNVIGIVATILIFIGVIAFGTLVFTSFTDTIKVISMFVASFLTVGAGLTFTKRNKTAFSEILTGCGMGMTYISLFISHLYFGIINDVFTFILIFLWSIGVSFVSKRFRLKSLSYIALGGCIISSIFSLIYGFASQKFVEITIYHILTFILLIISNKSNKHLFKISSFSSIILNTVLSGVIYSYIGIQGGINTLLPVNALSYTYLALCFVLAIYNIAIYVYSSKENLFDDVADVIFSNIIHYVSITVSFCLPFSMLLENVVFVNRESTVLYPITFIGTIFLVVVVSQIIYNVFNKTLAKKVFSFILSEVFLSIIIFATLTGIGDMHFATWLLFPVVNIFLYKELRRTNEKLADITYWSGMGILIIDVLLSTFILVEHSLFAPLYSIVLIALLTFYITTKFGDALHFPFAQAFLVNTHLLFTSFLFADKVGIVAVPILIIFVLINILWSGYNTLIRNKDNKISTILTEIMESIFAFILSIAIIFTKDASPISSFILSFLLIPFVLIRIKDVIDSKNGFMSVWYGLKFTFYMFMTSATFLHLLDQQFIFSLFFMFIAAICIVFGFSKELKSLRIYGLALIMASVFKMVVIDVWDQNSLIRVASLIVGGIICFAISAAYSKFEKKQNYIED